MFNKVESRGFISSVNGGNQFDIEQPTRFLNSVSMSGSVQFGTDIQPEMVYVSLSGSDTTGNGTYLSPYRTLVKAVNVISSSRNYSTAHPYVISLGAGTFTETIPINLPQSVAVIGQGVGMTRLTTNNTGSVFFNLAGLSVLDKMTIFDNASRSNVGARVGAISAVVNPVDPSTGAPKIFATRFFNFDVGVEINDASGSAFVNGALFNDCNSAFKINGNAFLLDVANTTINFSSLSGSGIRVENFAGTATDSSTPVVFARNNHFRYCENAVYTSNTTPANGARIAFLGTHFSSCSNVINLNDSSNLGLVSCQSYNTQNCEFYQGYPNARIKVYNCALEFTKVFIQPTGYENFVGAFPDRTDYDTYVFQGAHPELWLRAARALPTFWRIYSSDVATLQFDVNTHISGRFDTYQNFIALNPSGSMTVTPYLNSNVMNISGSVSMLNQSGIRFYDSGSSRYASFGSPTAYSASHAYVLPLGLPVTTSYLETDASGNLTWTTGTGEVNTASNLGSGYGLYAQKSGVDLQFKSFTANTASLGGLLVLSSSSTEIDVKVRPNSQTVSFFEDWIGSVAAGVLGWTTANNGAGSAASIVANGVDTTNKAIGVVQLATGTNTTGRVSLSQATNAFKVDVFKNISMEWRVNVPVLSTAAQEFGFICGLATATTTLTQSNGLYFLYNRLVYGDVWVVVAANGGIVTATATATAVSTTNFQKLRIDTVDGTSAAFYIDGTLVGTLTTNIPTSTQVGLLTGVFKSAGTTSRNVRVDYMDFMGHISGAGR